MASAQLEDNPTTSVNPNPRSVGLRPRTIKVDTQEKYCPTIIKKVMFAAIKSGDKEMLEEIIMCHPTVLQPPQVGQFIFAIVRYSHASSLALFPSSDCAIVQLEKDERTALHRTVYYEKIDIIDYLMYVIVNKFGDTPLHDACYYGKATALKTLIKHKPNPNLASQKDQKPLDSVSQLLTQLKEKGMYSNYPRIPSSL